MTARPVPPVIPATGPGRRQGKGSAAREPTAPVATVAASLPIRRTAEPERHLLHDLFEYQAIARGGWMVPDVAGCAV